MRHVNDSSFFDSGIRVKTGFDLRQFDPAAAPLDHPIAPASVSEVAIGLHLHDVASSIPPVSFSIAYKRSRIFCGRLPIAGGDARTGKVQLAVCFRSYIVARFVDDPAAEMVAHKPNGHRVRVLPR